MCVANSPWYRRVGTPSLMAMLLASTGCATGIEVTRVTSPVAIQRGNPWNLPMTRFTASITRHIVGCGAEIKGRVEVLPTAGVAVDDAQRYVLRSKGTWATSDITSALAPSGVSLGLNAQSTDTTATVISNVIGTVAQIAISLAAGAAIPLPPVPPEPDDVPPPPPPKAELCNDKVAAAVRELYPEEGSGAVALKKRVEEATANLELATARVELLAAQAKLDRSLRPELVAALGQQADRKRELDALQKTMAGHLKLTSHVQSVVWPPTSSEFSTPTPFAIPESVLDDWLTPQADRPQARARFAVHFALYRRNPPDSGWHPAGTLMNGNTAVNVSQGVPVRLAQMGRLLTCVESPCPTTSLEEGAGLDPKHSATEVAVLQLGQIYMVPVAGGHFRSESAAITLNDAGLPTSIQSSEKVAAAAVASGAAKDAATQIASLPRQVDAAQLARTEAELKQIKANADLAAAIANGDAQGQTSLLAAQAALINAQTNLATAKTNAGLPLQTAEASAQTALLNAQAALANAQANAQNIDQTSAWAAQAALANAQAAQINAAAALARAQAAN